MSYFNLTGSVKTNKMKNTTNEQKPSTFTHSIQLMENVYPGVPVSYRNQLFATRDVNDNTVLFTMKNEDELVVIQKSSNSTGYVETLLNPGLPSGQKLLKFAAGQGENGSSFVAVAIKASGDTSSVWYTELNTEKLSTIRKSAEADTNVHVWKKYNDYKGVIQHISVGSTKDNKPGIFLSVLKNEGEFDTGTIYVTGLDGREQKVELPESPKQILGFELTHNEVYERYIKNVSGLLYIHYSVEGGNRICSVTYPAVTVHEVPVDPATHAFALTERQGLPMLFTACNNKAYLYDNSFAPVINPGHVKNEEEPLLIGEFEQAVKEFHPSYNEDNDALQAFVLLKEPKPGAGGAVYHMSEAITASGAPKNEIHSKKIWNNPVLNSRNVLMMAAPYQNKNKETELYRFESVPSLRDSSGESNFVFAKQGSPESGALWNDQKIAVENREISGQYTYKSYSIHLQLNSEAVPQNEEPLKKKILVECSQNVMINIDRKAYHMNGSPIETELDSSGICSIEVPVSSPDSPLITVTNVATNDKIQIDPAADVKNKLVDITQNEDTLKNAKLKNPDGSPGDLLVSGSSQKNIGPVVSAVNQMHKVLPASDNVFFDNISLNTGQFSDFTLQFDASGNVVFKELQQSDLIQFYNSVNAGDENGLFHFIGDVLKFFVNAANDLANKLIDGFNVIVHKVEEGLKFIIQIGEQIWSAIIETASQIWVAVSSMLLNILKIAADVLMDFLSFLFPWEEIKRCQRAYKSVIVLAYSEAGSRLQKIKEDETIRKAFISMADTIFGKSGKEAGRTKDNILGFWGSQKGISFKGSSTEYSQESNKASKDPQANWSQSLLKSQVTTSSESGDTGIFGMLSIGDELKEKLIQELSKLAEEAGEDFQNNFNDLISDIQSHPDLSVGSILEKILNAIGRTILDETGDIVQAIFNIITDLLDAIWKLITTPMSSGILKSIVSYLTGIDNPTTLDIITFVMAVPAGIVAKASSLLNYDILPESEVLIMEEIANKPGGTLSEMITALESRNKNSGYSDTLMIRFILSESSVVLSSISSQILVPITWITEKVGLVITKILNLIISLINFLINIGLGIWQIVTSPYTNERMVELLYSGASGLFGLVIITFGIFNVATGPVWIVTGVFMLFGAVALAITEVIDAVEVVPTAHKIVDDVLKFTQNVSKGFATILSGTASILTKGGDPRVLAVVAIGYECLATAFLELFNARNGMNALWTNSLTGDRADAGSEVYITMDL